MCPSGVPPTNKGSEVALGPRSPASFRESSGNQSTTSASFHAPRDALSDKWSPAAKHCKEIIMWPSIGTVTVRAVLLVGCAETFANTNLGYTWESEYFDIFGAITSDANLKFSTIGCRSN